MEIKKKNETALYEDNQHIVTGKTNKKNSIALVWVYSFCLLGFGAGFLLYNLGIFDFAGEYSLVIQKFFICGILVSVIFIISKSLLIFVQHSTKDVGSKYNLVRLIRLITFIVVAAVIITVIFVNWYAAAASLGLISLILGFALQNPITSLIAWVYILIRVPYHVGDRIKIGNMTGDVVEIGYLDTTLWEFGGDFITSDMPSGRLIRFPNSTVLEEAVYNYSFDLFPFIWNEIVLNIAYESDLDYVRKVMVDTAVEDIGEYMSEHIAAYKKLLEETAIDDLEINEYPSVSFKPNNMTWIDAKLRYLVNPKGTTQVKTRLTTKLLKNLLQHPDKVMFPKLNNR